MSSFKGSTLTVSTCPPIAAGGWYEASEEYGSSQNSNQGQGQITYNSEPFVYGRERGRTYYELSNHLGNVLVTVTDLKIGISTDGDDFAEYYEATVVSAVDYYPFACPETSVGSAMAGRKYNQGTYRYGFNGKEEDKEWGSPPRFRGRQMIQDYGFRIYNPTIGKFLSVDPLAPDYPWYTPYQFAGNMPIAAIDLDGLEPVVTKEGVLVGYTVIKGDRPTQIAAYLNDPANQKEHGYVLAKPVKWIDIIDYLPNQKYFDKVGEKRYDKKNENYTSLNMNEGNYINLGYLGASQGYGDKKTVGSFQVSEKERYGLLVEVIRDISNDYKKGKFGKENSPTLEEYFDFSFTGLPGYDASALGAFNRDADYRALEYDRFFVQNNEGVRIRVELTNKILPIEGFEPTDCSVCSPDKIILKSIPKQDEGTWVPDPSKALITIEFELDTEKERIKARENFVKDVEKND